METFNMSSNNELGSGVIFSIGEPLPDIISKFSVGQAING